MNNRWVVTSKDLKTFHKVHLVVGGIFTILMIPIVIFVLLGAVSEKVQDWVAIKIVWNIAAYITAVINRMWKNKLPPNEWMNKQIQEMKKIQDDN